MRHEIAAVKAMTHNELSKYISVSIVDDPLGRPKDEINDNITVSFQLQSHPVGEVGVNGCQATEIIEFVRNLIVEMNRSYPCDENIDTIHRLGQALECQADRTADRESRDVEGKGEL